MPRLLDVPYEARSLAKAAGAEWVKGVGWLWNGTGPLPAALIPYDPEPYSWMQFFSDPTPGNPNPDPTTGSFTLRPDQNEDADAILTARAHRAPEFLLASQVGTGKTAVLINAVKRMAGVRTVLVVCPLPVAASWRTHLWEMGDGGKRWCIINYESLKRLLEEPPAAAKAKRQRTKNLHYARSGKPKVAWDVVISDESHYVADPTSQRSRTLERIIAAKPAFSIRVSATAGSNPAQLAYLHRGFAWRTGAPVKDTITAEQYQQFCQRYNVDVKPGRFGTGLTWERDPKELRVMHALMFGGSPKWAVRRIPGWPVQQRILTPIDLDATQRALYDTEWALFKKAMKDADRARAHLTGRARSTAIAKGLAAQIRYRQKAGLVRAPGTAQFAAELVSKGMQVAISCEYTATVNELRGQLTKAKIPTVIFTGENRDTREQDRLAYQRGDAKVIIFTPAEGFSLHATERGANGVPRATVVAEPRWSPKKALQIEGRSSRDGETAPCYYPYALGTIEDKVIRTMVAGMADTGALMGDDDTPFTGLAAALGVPL